MGKLKFFLSLSPRDELGPGPPGWAPCPFPRVPQGQGYCLEREALCWTSMGADVISPWGPRDFTVGPTWFPLGAHVISPWGPRDFPVGPT